MQKVKYALIIPDTHIPYEDKRSYELMLKIARQGLPHIDSVVILGDYGEFATVGSHPKDPDLENFLKKETDAVNERLNQLDRLFPKAEKVYIEGNHENRFDRYIRDKAPQLYGLMSIKKLLRLDKRPGWKWIPYGPNQKVKVLNSKLYARHEPAGSGDYTAAQTVRKCGASVVYGHTHRVQEYQTVMLNGDSHRAINSGWLGDANHKIFEYVKNHHQWGHAFSIVTVLPNGLFFNNTIHIIDHKAVFGNKLYVG